MKRSVDKGVPESRVTIWPGHDGDGLYLGIHHAEHFGHSESFVRCPIDKEKARRMARALLELAESAE